MKIEEENKTFLEHLPEVVEKSKLQSQDSEVQPGASQKGRAHYGRS